MSSSVHSQRAQSQAGWITPEEQLKLLELIEFPIVEKTARIIAEIPELFPCLAHIIAQYAVDPKLTGWYTGLKSIGCLPKKVPPLDICKIFNSKCPKLICDNMKPDEIYTLGEKCTLTLVSEELRTINAFESLAKAYGGKQYPGESHPLQFYYFWYNAHQIHGDVPFGPTHWELQTERVLAGSLNKSPEEQTALVDSLAQETSMDWQVAELPGTIAAIFLKKIATGENLYSYLEARKISIRVKETMLDKHMVVTNYSIGLGVAINEFVKDKDDDIGVAAVLKF